MIRFRLASTKQILRNKLAVGGIIAATTAAVSVAGIAGAAPMMNPTPNTPISVAMCKTDFKKLGFKNVGQCISAAQHAMGHGYGNNNVNVNTTVNVADNHGVINIITNFFFGG